MDNDRGGREGGPRESADDTPLHRARAEEAAELRVRLQLTEQAQSTIEEGRRRVEEELAEERRRREAAERRSEDLERRLQEREEAAQISA